MATIEQDVAAIRTAVYGKDVREAIADGIEKCYGNTIAPGQIAIIQEAVQQAESDIQEATEEAIGTIPSDYTELSHNVIGFAKNLAIDFTWVDGKTYSVSTGEEQTVVNNSHTYKVVGDDFTKQFNYESLLLQNSNESICLWRNSVYIGYFFRGNYKDPSGTTITKPNYDMWGLNAGTSDTGNFHLYTVAYENVVDDIKKETQQLIAEFTWSNGYYNFNAGEPDGPLTSYHKSNKMDSSQYSFANPSIFNSSTSNFVSLWYDGSYVGYYLNGNYYNPSRTQVEALTYDQWAVNMYTENYEQLKPNSLVNRVENLENAAFIDSRYQHLNGLKIGFLGDSITYGIGASDPSKSYVALMNTEFGAGNVFNYGVNGSLIASSSSAQVDPSPMSERYEDMSDDLDVVVVCGGINDWYYGTAWGTVNSTDTDTFLGALNVLLSGLVDKYCGKEIFIVTPMSSAYSNKNTDNTNPDTGKTLREYRDAIIEMAGYHAIPVIDLYAICGMDVAHNASQKTYYSSDGIHPNDNGHKRIHDRIVTFISNTLY